MSNFKFYLPSIIAGFVGAIAAGIVEYIITQEWTGLYATLAGLVAGAIAFLVTFWWVQRTPSVSEKRTIMVLGKGLIQDFSSLFVVTRNKTISLFSRILPKQISEGFILLIAIVVLILALGSVFALSDYYAERRYKTYAVLESIEGDMVTVRASVYADSKYVIEAAYKGCIRINEDFVPINMGYTVEFSSNPTSKWFKHQEKLLINSYRCVTVEEAKRIREAEKWIEGT